jgi:hypothetical protein
MNNYQLFSKLPTENILDKLEDIYPIKGFRNNTIHFSKYDMERENTVEKLKEFVPELEKYYMPCKQKTFLRCITLKKGMTILRQILRIFGYKIKSKEKFVRYRKYYEYWIVYDEELLEKDAEKHKRRKNYIVYFD